MITTAKFVSIPVDDQQRAMEFYRDMLGFEVRADAPYGEEMGGGAEGGRWIVVAPKGGQTGFNLYPAEALGVREAGGMSPIVFDSDDIAATCEDLKAKGVEVTAEPAQMPWGWWAQFKDSEGNEFGLGQSEE
jgi:predicted enzyme related to lactoylglutathione lyase